MAIRRRVNVWNLAPEDDVLVWYARAIRELQQRPLTNSTSYGYLAAVHDRLLTSQPGEPSSDEQGLFWRQCQHGSWFFLPWHRMYLAYFEQIVAAAICQMGGPRDWALPYWNPSDLARCETRTLPHAFRAVRLGDVDPNPLRVEERDDGVNDGHQVVDEQQVSLQCLCESEFAGRAKGGGTGFGGPEGSEHHGTRRGQLEYCPHGGIHSGVGGPMGSPEKAALDPIFFLHHANIDRLWVVWRQRDARHVDPTDRAWLDQAFAFHDANGQPVCHAVSEWVDPATAPLPFEYDDASDPMAGQCDEGLFTWSTTRRTPVELASTTSPVRIAGGPVRIELRRAPGDAANVKYDGISRAFLDIEGITGHRVSGNYRVFLSYAGQPPSEQTLVGVLPMFGLSPAGDDDDREHAHHQADPHRMSLTYELDVTSAIRRNGVLAVDGLVVTLARAARADREQRRVDDDEPLWIARLRLTLA